MRPSKTLDSIYARQLKGKKRADALDKRYGGKLPDNLNITKKLSTHALKGHKKN